MVPALQEGTKAGDVANAELLLAYTVGQPPAPLAVEMVNAAPLASAE